MSSARCVEVADTVLFTREEAETASDERPAKIQKLDREEWRKPFNTISQRM